MPLCEEGLLLPAASVLRGKGASPMNAPRFRMPHLNEEQVMHAMSIDDAYHIERVLAEGCAGVTECVTIEGVGPFVRKRIPSKLANRGVWAALAECSNPRLPQMAATYEMPDQFIAVYDFVPGDTLAHIMASCGRLEAGDAVQMVREVAEAVSDLHAHGIVHCDLAPSNIILAADGAHLIDFGIAQLTGRGMTADSVPLGTWGFAAPEQYGFAPVDVRTDVFSLARILGYVLCGIMPDDEVFSARLADESIVSPVLRSVIERGSSFEPSLRYQSCAALAEAAEDALRGEIPGAGQKQSSASNAPFSSDTRPAVEGTSDLPKSGFSGMHRKITLIVLVAVAVVACITLTVVSMVPQMQNLITDAFQGSGTYSDELSKEASSEAPLMGGTPSDEAKSSAADDLLVSEMYEALSLVETGWSADLLGYIRYGFGLRNDSADAAVVLPTVTIVGRDDNGAVLFSQDQVLNSIYPGQTIYFGAPVGNGAVPASVDFTIKKPTEFDILSNVEDPPVLNVSNTSAVNGRASGKKFTGEVELVGGKLPNFGMGGAALTVILRDAEGSLVFGDTAFVDGLQEGESIPFEINCPTVPDYVTFEIHAQPW